ncbi:hypothetical protein T11_10931 [Trichinella zimbabwensis]|uniref:Uncharacterized protein n=1 Tax=Trichinella zimbabwensis TaxID=268475 RepID=A0A0V1HRU5_9BILA|nr:hypothetical protein T11_10931 [Trichinella zimbabwensis]
MLKLKLKFKQERGGVVAWRLRQLKQLNVVARRCHSFHIADTISIVEPTSSAKWTNQFPNKRINQWKNSSPLLLKRTESGTANRLSAVCQEMKERIKQRKRTTRSDKIATAEQADGTRKRSPIAILLKQCAWNCKMQSTLL